MGTIGFFILYFHSDSPSGEFFSLYHGGLDLEPLLLSNHMEMEFSPSALDGWNRFCLAAWKWDSMKFQCFRQIKQALNDTRKHNSVCLTFLFAAPICLNIKSG